MEHFYTKNLIVVSLVSAAIFAWRYWNSCPCGSSRERAVHDVVRRRMALRLQCDFFVVYSLAACADWIQGPHLYAFYVYEKGISERCTSYLYATGFLFAAVSGLFVGKTMDRLGTTIGCQIYFLLTSLSCVALTFNNVLILFAGRAFGGMATTVLWTAFECWIIRQCRTQGIDENVLPLKKVLAKMTLLNTIIAISMGLVGDALVQIRGSLLDPFLAAVGCSLVAIPLSCVLWRRYLEFEGVAEPQVAWRELELSEAVLNCKVATLAAVSAGMEAAMYVFVFYWTEALQSFRDKAGDETPVPLGTAFAGFMAAMSVGSSIVSAPRWTPSMEMSRGGLLVILAVAGAALLLSEQARDEKRLYYAFCVFEVCIGAYYPTLGFLKSQLVRSRNRNVTYGLFRVPVNLLTILYLVLSQTLKDEGEGGDWHRHATFWILSGSMGFLVIICACVLRCDNAQRPDPGRRIPLQGIDRREGIELQVMNAAP